MTTSKSPEATRTLERLLEVIREEFKDASANILTSLSIYDLAGKKIQAIIDVITSIKDDFHDDRAWKMFDGYVDDIYTLEEFFLSLRPPVAIEMEPKDVASSLNHMEVWTKEREERKKTLKSALAWSSSKNGTLGSWESNLDDSLLLRAMVDRIETDESTCIISCEKLRLVHKELEKLLARAEEPGSGLSPEAVEYAIKTAWLVSAAVEEAHTPGTSVPRKYHLSQNEVWGFGTSLVAAIQAGEGASLVTKYRDFQAQLKVPGLNLPEQRVLSLILASRDVPRPFMFQNRTLVKYCEQLVRLYNSNESQQLSTVKPVERALLVSLTVLKDASKCSSGLPGDTISPSKRQEINDAYKEAATAVAKALEAFSPLDSAQIRPAMETALGRDDARMREIHQKIGETVARPKEKITVLVKGGSNNGPREYPADTKIGAFIWEEREKGNKHITGVQNGDRRLNTSQTLGDVAKPGSRLELRLVSGEESTDDESSDGESSGEEITKSLSLSPPQIVPMPTAISDSPPRASQLGHPWDMISTPPIPSPSMSSRILPSYQPPSSNPTPGPQPLYPQPLYPRTPATPPPTSLYANQRGRGRGRGQQ